MFIDNRDFDVSYISPIFLSKNLRFFINWFFPTDSFFSIVLPFPVSQLRALRFRHFWETADWLFVFFIRQNEGLFWWKKWKVLCCNELNIKDYFIDNSILKYGFVSILWGLIKFARYQAVDIKINWGRAVKRASIPPLFPICIQPDSFVSCVQE